MEEQIRKARLFLDTYGLKLNDRELIPQMMADRLTNLIRYMKIQAENGNQDFQKNIDEGHMDLYINDVQYILKNERTIIDGIK